MWGRSNLPVFSESRFGSPTLSPLRECRKFVRLKLLFLEQDRVPKFFSQFPDLILRWRIQRAFYTPASVGSWGCAGISWRDLFLRCPTCRTQIQRINLSRSLTLEDLDDVKPIYIGGITINKWRRTTFPKEPDYELLTMSPNGIERIDRPPQEREFGGKLMPMDVYLSDAMATSAAAVDHHMGAREGDDASFKDLKVMLGVAMGTAIVADERHEGKRNCCIQVKLIRPFVSVKLKITK